MSACDLRVVNESSFGNLALSNGSLRHKTCMTNRILLLLILTVLLIGPCAADAAAGLLLTSYPYNFGQINQGATTPIKHNFILKNENDFGKDMKMV